MICPVCRKLCRTLFGDLCRRCAGKDYSSAAWKALVRATRERDGYQCLSLFWLTDTRRWIKTGGCGCSYITAPEDLQAAHIVPRADGGTDDPQNLVTLCRSCHGRQTAREDGAMGNPRRLGFMNAQLTAQERAARTKGRPAVIDELLTDGDLAGLGEDW